MSKTCKKLLASALAAAMLITTFVSSFVVSAATTGTLTIEDTTITVGAEEAVVNFELAFDAFVEAPHELATITANPALTIKDIALVDVTYETAPVDPEDPEIESPALKIKTDGINKNAGKVLFESGVDGAVKASEINFTVTFDTTEAAVGTYTVSAAIASTDINEADIAINCDDTAVIVVEAAVPVCDHANATLEYAVVDGNCITTKVCPDCDAEPVVIANLANLAVTPALNLSAGLQVRFRVYKNQVAGTDSFAIINHDLYSDDTTISGTTDDVTITPEQTGSASNPRLQYTYEVLAAKEMLSEIHVQIFAKDAEDNVILVAATDFVLASYLKSTYIDVTHDYKTLAADILRYGAESQKAFDYREGVLPTAGVPEDAFSALPTTFTNTTVTQGKDNLVNLEPSTVLLNTVTLRFRASVIDGITAEQLTYSIKYTNEAGVETTYTSNAGEVGYNGNSTKYQFEFSKLPVAIINDYYTITLYNGEDVIATFDYCFQSDAASKYASSHVYSNLTQAICAYSASAAAKFKTN